MRTVFCVEDDASIRQLVLYALESAGFAARGFEDGESFFAALNTEEPDMVLLDIMLPGEDGILVLKRLKTTPKTQDIPVIMLTAKAAEYDKVIGLDLGADDYITKPFGVMELISRINAVLRRTGEREAEDFLSFGLLSMDNPRRRVMVGENEIQLTFKEYELLHYLLRNQGLVLNREQMIESVWGFDFEGETRTVDMHIKSLRQKLGEAGAYIQTVRGVGYRIGG